MQGQMSNLNLQKLRKWVWPWPWTFKVTINSDEMKIIDLGLASRSVTISTVSSTLATAGIFVW